MRRWKSFGNPNEGGPGRGHRAIDKVLAHADCQSAIQPIDNRRYSVAQTGSLLYRRLLTGCGCATICANFVNGPGRGHDRLQSTRTS
ncbi:MAG: hypothetical protein DME18_04340 [Verrucomicrobia bacterium]|nr:MAG: hypothetical protein DME18_04340 [Verrucomicrobiota bacterium]